MNRAAELAGSGAPEGALVVAAEQRQGRGRRGRSWDTPAGKGLALSLVLRPPEGRYRALGMIGGLAVVSALEAYQLRPAIKWPNDVLLGGRKLCGVLAEASWSGQQLEYVVLGIGINLLPAARSGAYAFPATSLREHLPDAPDPNRVALQVLEGLERWYVGYLEHAVHPEWEDHLAFRGELIELTVDRSAFEAHSAVRLLGLTPQGGLRLERSDGTRFEIDNGGTSLRPIDSGLA